MTQVLSEMIESLDEAGSDETSVETAEALVRRALRLPVRLSAVERERLVRRSMQRTAHFGRRLLSKACRDRSVLADALFFELRHELLTELEDLVAARRAA